MKCYDLEEVEKGTAVVGQDLMSLLQKLADNKPVDTNERNNEAEITRMGRTKVGSCEENQLESRDSESKEVLRILVERRYS